jgi:Ni,Fe-hydrogenase I large subunit
LAAALRKGAEAGLDKDEVGRLQVVATLAKTYKEAFADYLDYRGLAERLLPRPFRRALKNRPRNCGLCLITLHS